MKKVAGLIRLVLLGLVAAAIVQELRKPAGERTWQGEVAGFVPYNFRPPTLERIQAAFWAPDDPRLLTPHAFGVGWSVNLARLLQLSGVDLA